MWRKIKQELDSIRGKLIFFFLLSILFIGGVTWQCQKHLLFVSIKSEEEAYVSNLAGQIMVAMEDDRERCENFLHQSCYNKNLPLYLSATYTDYEKVWESARNIDYFVKERMAMMPGIKAVQICHTNTTFCEDGKYLFYVTKDEMKECVWKKWIFTQKRFGIIQEEVNGMFQEEDAYIKLIFDLDYIFGNYLQENETFNGNYYIFDENWNYIAGTDTGYGPNIDASAYSGLEKNKVYRDQKRKLLITNATETSWNVIVEYPMSGYSSNKVRAGMAICAILIVYCLIAGIFLISYIQRVTGRIYRIGTNMEEIGSHRFKILDQMRGHDEISRLENQYNGMLKKLEQTIEEMTEIKTKRQSLEIKVLESQINPHFLYNTLGVMRWKALGAENDELCRMIDNMTTFYRLSLSKGQGLITVKNEVELIRAYIALQQYRYDDCVDYHIDVEDEALQILMPKMILQPLVENIYLHADIVLEGKRKIGIEIKKREERIYIKVRDNGNGMTEETLYNVNHNINLSEEHGIGISFIYSSLQVFYGEEGKMEFHSIQGKGTCVEISFPTQTKWEASGTALGQNTGRAADESFIG